MPGLCYLGTEDGPFVSFNGGDRWERLSLDLPAVPIYDLLVKDGDLVVATHGRGFYILDDGAALLRQLHADRRRAPEAFEADPWLFVPPARYRYSGQEALPPSGGKTQYRETATVAAGRAHNGALTAVPLDAGLNPPDGVAIVYLLPEAADGVQLSLRILDSTGRALVSSGCLRSRPDEQVHHAPFVDEQLASPEMTLGSSAGLHRVDWNLRLPAAALANAGLVDLVEVEGGGQGPRVPPGRYRVELRVDTRMTFRDFELVADPKLGLTQEQYEEQFALSLRIQECLIAVNDGIRLCHRLSTRIDSTAEIRPGGMTSGAGPRDARTALSKIESRLTQPRWRNRHDARELPAGLDGRLITLVQAVGAGDAEPTNQSRQLATQLFAEVSEVLGELDDLVAGLPRR